MMRNIKYIACCLAGVISLLPLQAQNIIRPKIQGPNNLWVNSYNGVLFFEQIDLETQNSAMPMRLQFYYNSSSSTINYGYGLGFSMGFEMRYKEDVIGGVDIETGDGRIDHFVRYGDDYEAPAGVFSTLTRPSSDSYLLTTKEGEKYFFDNPSHRKVTAIEDRYGNRTTLKYQDTLLVEIKDAVGHTITLNYTDGLLTQASATFSPGKFKYEYDGLRRLRKRIDTMGNVTLYDYSRQNKLDEITDANGNKTLIAYNSSGMVSRMKTDVSDKSIRYEGDKTIFIDYSEPKNVYSYYRWDEKGRAIEKVGLCCGIQSKQKYDDNDNLVQFIDAKGNTTTYFYDNQGNVLKIQDPLGYSEQWTYDLNFNQVTSYCDKNGNRFNYSYDTKGNLNAISGPLGYDNRYIYDEHGWQTMITDSNGGVTRINYNLDGTTESIINADGGVINYAYDSYGRISAITDPMGNITSYTYDNLNRITKQTNALGYSTSASYDKVGNIVRVIDADGNITSYTYNALGKITSMTDAIGGVTTYDYDGLGNIISIVNPLGVKQEFTYNDRNRIESFTNGEKETTNYDYDVNNNLIAIMKPNGNVVSYEYDQSDRLIEISDNIGLIAGFEYDGNGNRISMIDGLDRIMTFSFDALNRKTSEKLPSGSITQYRYDANGNLISTIDALGNVNTFSYDAMNHQISQTNASNAKTQFFFDANGNMTRIIDANGNTTTYSFDALNQNTAITFANGRSKQFSYDEMGRIISQKDCIGNEFKFTYNPNGKLISKTYPDGTKDTYTYDALNRMLSATNKNAILSFAYDNAGRIINESINGKYTSYIYDVAGGKRTLIYPSGLKVVELYNARDMITCIFQNGEQLVSIDYNVANQLKRKSYANGIITNYEYNNNGWLSKIDDNNQIQNYQMNYDLVGNLTERIDLLNYNNNETYSYDADYQLTAFRRGSALSQIFEFDLLGNRIRMIENDIETIYISNNVNSYTSIIGNLNQTLNYDGNGNLLNYDDNSYVYDYNNKLIGSNGIETKYKYDALGRRTGKDNTVYYYAGDQMIEEVTNGLTSSYIFGNNIDDIILMKSNNHEYYYHTNQLGSTMALSDSEGNLIERVEYDVYGKPYFYDNNNEIITESVVGNNILFSGHEYDMEIEASYMRNRHMNNILGRFYQKDNLIYKDGMNDYTYVLNSPLRYVDPYGQAVIVIAIPIYALIGQAAIDATAIGLGAYFLNNIQPTFPTSDSQSRTRDQDHKNDNNPCKNGRWKGVYKSFHDCQCANRSFYPYVKCDDDDCFKKRPDNWTDPSRKGENLDLNN